MQIAWSADAVETGHKTEPLAEQGWEGVSP
jgi:hypothetical protein